MGLTKNVSAFVAGMARARKAVEAFSKAARPLKYNPQGKRKRGLRTYVPRRRP